MMAHDCVGILTFDLVTGAIAAWIYAIFGHEIWLDILREFVEAISNTFQAISESIRSSFGT